MSSNVVVGGGIIGLLAAWYLIKAGKTVVVVDQGSIGGESSWAGGGILLPLYPDRYPALASLVRESEREYVSIVRDLVSLSGIDPQLIFSGLLILDHDETVLPSSAWPQGISLTYDQVIRLEPEVALERGRGAICYPAAQVRNPRLLSALRSVLSSKGVTFREACEVRGFDISGNSLVGIQVPDGIIKAHSCIVAAGAWTGKLMKSVGLSLPIKPMRGQMISFVAQPGLISHIIVRGYRYLVPRADGRILAGSTVEDVGFDKRTTMIARDALRQAAIELVPALAEYPIECHWAGLRPGSPDDTPFIGEHPTISGLFVCSGHHRNGFATAPASSRLVVELLLRRSTTIAASPYALSRPMPDWKTTASIK